MIAFCVCVQVGGCLEEHDQNVCYYDGKKYNVHAHLLFIIAPTVAFKRSVIRKRLNSLLCNCPVGNLASPHWQVAGADSPLLPFGEGPRIAMTKHFGSCFCRNVARTDLDGANSALLSVAWGNGITADNMLVDDNSGVLRALLDYVTKPGAVATFIMYPETGVIDPNKYAARMGLTLTPSLLNGVGLIDRV